MGRRCLFSLGWSRDGVTIKMPYGVDVLHHPSFPIGFVKTESDFIVRPFETGLEK